VFIGEDLWLTKVNAVHRQNIIFVTLLLIMAVAIVAVGYATGRGPLAVVGDGISRVTSGGQMFPSSTMTEETKARVAPEISSGLWINSEPLTLKSLHGRVVLIEFWTFACYNCRNVLPAMKKWDAQYRDKGLTIIGVHTPELDFERDIDQLRREVAALGVKYAVVTDQDYSTWKAYGVKAWPTLFLLDKQGRVRWTHVGEGYYDQTEEVIKKLLAEESEKPWLTVLHNWKYSAFVLSKFVFSAKLLASFAWLFIFIRARAFCFCLHFSPISRTNVS
jgi:thiol-disulfide isomerase/thioredoxin